MWYWRFRTCCKFKWRGWISVFVYHIFDWHNQKMWSDININTKWIHASKTLAFTIRESVILLNILHVTLTCLFISWFSGATNVEWTLRVWNYYLNPVKVNCNPASAKMISKSHQTNLPIFSNLDRNISSLSITCSVEIFSLP